MPTRRQLLWGGAGLGLLARAGLATGAPTGKRFLFVYVHGGWDPSYHLDPKMDSAVVEGPELDASNEGNDVEYVDVIQGHRLQLNDAVRPQVASYFQRWGDRTLTILGSVIGGIAHYPNRMRLLTGGTDRDRPDVVALVGAEVGTEVPFGAIDLSGWSFHGAQGANVARAGRLWQLGQILDPTHAGVGLRREPVPDEDALVERYLRERAQAWEQASPGSRWPVDLARSLDRVELLRGRRDELAGLLEAGQPGSADDNLALAVDLLARGFTQSVLVDSQYYFDTHDTVSDQSPLANGLFRSLSAMMDRLDTAGILDDTVVLVGSEMTRSPGRNLYRGKDHWPVLAWLAMGGGIQGGRAIGATDDSLVPLPMDVASGELWSKGTTLSYKEVLAGILAQVGVDPALHFPDTVPLGGLG